MIVVLAGGIGTRLGLGFPKQFYQSNGGDYIINFLLKNIKNEFDKIVVVVDEKYNDKILEDKKIIVVKNGQTRLESLQNGISKISEIAQPNDLIFIHDGARIFLNKNDIELHKQEAKKGKGLVSIDVSIDTMFRIDDQNLISEVIPKNEIVKGYNPQSFFWEDLKKNEDKIFSASNDQDLSQILLKEKFPIKVLEQVGDLRKVTNPGDIDWLDEKIKWMK